MKIFDIGDEEVYIKALVYALYGVGKTRFAGTAAEHPKMRDLLLVRCEDGHATITHQACKMTPKIRSMKEMEKLFWDLSEKRTQTFTTVNDKGEKVTERYDFANVRTVIIDSGTALLQTCLEEVVAEKIKKDKDKEPFPTIRDFGIANFMMTKLLRQFFDLEMNVILTALVREDYNTSDPEDRMRRGPSLCRPDFTPKLANRVMSFADSVWWMEAKQNGDRILHTQPKTPWVAKTRGDVFAKELPDAIKDPDLPNIYNLLQNVQPEKEEKTQ